jgi:hypothetical protein
MSITVKPADADRAKNYANAPAQILKFQHRDGSITAPDPADFGEEHLPADPQRAALWERAPAENVKYMFPDGSVRDGEGNTEASGGGSGGGVTPGQVNSAINTHNQNAGPTAPTHPDIRQAVTDETTRATNAEAGLQTQINTINASPYLHAQNTASAVWTIPHNLGKQFVDVQIIDNTGTTSEAEITYTSANIVTLNFSIPMTGSAIIRR